MTLAAFLADTLARWGAMMQRPLHEPVPVPPLSDLMRRHREMVEAIEAPLNREAERAARDYEDEKRVRSAALLPSTDYRTNPRPSQVATVPRCYY